MLLMVVVIEGSMIYGTVCAGMMACCDSTLVQPMPQVVQAHIHQEQQGLIQPAQVVPRQPAVQLNSAGQAVHPVQVGAALYHGGQQPMQQQQQGLVAAAVLLPPAANAQLGPNAAAWQAQPQQGYQAPQVSPAGGHPPPQVYKAETIQHM